MTDAASLRLTFVLGEDEYLLSEVTPHMSPAPFNKVKRRAQNPDGCWIQSEDKDGNVLYWTSLFFERNESKDSISVLIPYNETADRITACLPASDGKNLKTEHFPLHWDSLNGEWKVRRKLEAVSLPCDICGEGKGTVLRTETVKYHGYTEHLYNLVILSDKYTSGDLEHFRTRANRCIEYLLNNPPFDTAIGNASMNVYFVEIGVTNAGESYFDVSYSKEKTQVEWSTNKVKKVCDALFSNNNGFPYWTWAGVLINECDTPIGTSNTSKAQFTCGNYSSKNVSCVASFRHEFSHAAFNLADEYSYEGDGRYTGEEPSRPNITTNLDRNTIKWKAFLTEGVSLPTTGDKKNVVGAYEGASHYETGIYRPQYDCIMRNSNNKGNKFCKVCDNEAKLVVAKAFGINVPAPGIMTYSRINQNWNDVSIIFESREALLEKEVKKSYYDNLWNQLESGDVSTLVGSLFKDATKKKLDANSVIIDCQSNGIGDYGVWYLSIDGCSEMYYFYLSLLARKYRVAVGCISAPPYLPDSCFDGATTGQVLHAFCVDGYRLAYGQMGLYSINGVSFTEQTVVGIDSTHAITALSVANFMDKVIFVAIVDNGTIKIGAYELSNQAWGSEGFIAMQQEENENYEKVKIAINNRCIYVVGKRDDNALIGTTFNISNRSWSGNKKQIADTDQDIYCFDVCTYNKAVLVTSTTYNQTSGGEAGNVLVCFWNPDTHAAELLDANAASRQVLGTYDAAVTSFGSEVIGNELHCVMLKGADAVDIVYDLSYDGTEYKAMPKREDKIQPLNQNREVGTFVIHSDGNQIYLVLSGRTKIKDS